MPDRLSLTVTRDPAQVRAAQALRHRVFVEEMGAAPSSRPGLEADAYDADCDHLLLRDAGRPDLGPVATMRLGYGRAGFWTAREFDLSPLLRTGLRLAEPGRACLHRDYRGGSAGLLLFAGMLDHLRARGVGLVVGTASFRGADPAPHLPALRRLRAAALAPAGLRPVPRGPQAVAVAGSAPSIAMRDVPSLIKSYLRAGAWVGEGAWIDAEFNTVDVCMVLDMARARLPVRAPRPAAAHA